MVIDINEEFTEEERQRFRVDYESIYNRVMGGECGDNIKRDIDKLYGYIREVVYTYISSRPELFTSLHVGLSQYIKSELNNTLEALGIGSPDALYERIKKKSYTYLPEPVVETDKGVVYIFMGGKEYKCIPTGRTEEKVIEEKAEALIKKREKEKEERRMRERLHRGPRESGLLDIMFG